MSETDLYDLEDDASTPFGALSPVATAALDGPSLEVGDATRGALGQTLGDLWESGVRVAAGAGLPSREGLAAFFGNQLLVNAVAWTAGLLAAGVVRSFFEVRGFGNLWGLLASRNAVSAEEYQLLTAGASYATGLVMMILMRHFAIRFVSEFRWLRRVRAAGAPASERPNREKGLDGVEAIIDDLTDD